MRVLAFSDLHRDRNAADAVLAASKDADVVVGAGDFATQAVGANDTLALLENLDVPFILVHGNHDDPEELGQLVARKPNMHLLHGSSVTIGQTVFFGLGGEVPELNNASWNAALSEDDARKFLKPCPDNAVLITHTPPLGHCDMQRDGTHEGSAAILECVEEKQPSHVLCGHIHNAWGMRSSVGNSVIHNIGPAFAWHNV